jgi:hypothetical protein
MYCKLGLIKALRKIKTEERKDICPTIPSEVISTKIIPFSISDFWTLFVPINHNQLIITINYFLYRKVAKESNPKLPSLKNCLREVIRILF